MKQHHVFSSFVIAVAVMAGSQAMAQDAIDVGQTVPDAKAIAEGLFPDSECKALAAAGYICMGFKPAVRYSLPASSFKLGSAELPDALRRQLEVFAEVIKTKRASDQVVRVEGHADASGTAAANQALSQRRAEAVRDFLVEQGADAKMIQPVGVGSEKLKNSKDPYSPENRRVEIGRATPPS
jgi:outer membrane protein OmpA-like peptidoglycan-associated protein